MFGQFDAVLSPADAHHVLSLGQFETVLERDVMPDFLEGFPVTLEIGEGVVDLQP